MTGLISTTLHDRADALAVPDVDLAGIVQAGDRRLRHRRAGITGGVVAVLAAAVAFGGVRIAQGGNGTARDGTAADFAAIAGTDSVGYAVGSVVHSGDATVDVGHDIAAYVPTATGIVLADHQHDVYVVAGSAPRAIGRYEPVDGLVADHAGTTVAWVDGSSIEVYQVGHDVPASVPADSGSNAEDGPTVQAIDDGTVWYWDGRQEMTYDVASGVSTRVGGEFLRSTLLSVSAGRMLVSIDQGNGGLETQVVPVGGAPRDVGTVRNVGSGFLSPDGQHWLSDDADQAMVFESTTGDRWDLPHPGFAFAAPFAWLDDDTVEVVALRKAENTAPLSLLTCRLSSRSCSVAAADLGTYHDVTIPVGVEIGG